MERLGTCIDALRVLARSSDGDRAVLVERYIDAYLTTETVSVWHAVERLGKAIHDEHAKRREGEDWSERLRPLGAAQDDLAVLANAVETIFGSIE
jgi:hypothetical protein